MKKRIAVLLCVLLCAFGLTACSSSGASNDMTDKAAAYEPTAVSIVEGITGSESLEQLQQMDAAGEISLDGAADACWAAWESAKEELGQAAGIQTESVAGKYESQNKLFIVNMDGKFEKRDAQITVTFDREGKLEAVAFNPNYSFSEKMGKAAMNTVMGLGVVFVMLVLISLIIYCFNFIHAAEEKAKAKNAAAVPAPVAAPVPVEEAEEDLTDDLELVAVIAAAIAASEGTSPNGLVVRSIRRVGKNNWKRA